MSENSIAQTDATTEADEVRTWYFTFGGSHVHPTTGEDLTNAYVTITDTYNGARDRMWAAFGNRWAFQYDTADGDDPTAPSMTRAGRMGGAGVKRFNLHEVEMPEPAVEAESKIWACPEPDCGYHIADGPTADGEPSTDELINEHMEEHTPVDAWALVEPTPAETVDAEVMPEPPETERTAYTRGLREIAAWLDAHPEVDLPHLGSGALPDDIPSLNIYVLSWTGDARARLAAVGRAMGRFDKVVTDVGPKGRMNLVRQFGGVRIVASADRDEVCRRVVVSSHEVEVEVPDPSVVATVPLVKVKQLVEEVRWECPPLLAEPARVADAITPDSAELPAPVAF